MFNEYKFRYSVLYKAIEAIVIGIVCLFVVNDLAWADPSFPKRDTLAPPNKLADTAFREEFLTNEFLLSFDGVKHYVNEQAGREKDIFKDNWEELRTAMIEDIYNTFWIKGRFSGKVPGLKSMVFVKLSGLLASTGQPAIVDLLGEMDASREFGGISVVYIDSALCNTTDKCIQKHEIDEMLQWEDLRINVLGINSNEKMGHWIRKHINKTDEKLKGTICEGLNSREIAKLFYSYSYPVRNLYSYTQSTPDFDYGYIARMLQMYGTDEKNARVNIAATNSVEGRKGDAALRPIGQEEAVAQRLAELMADALLRDRGEAGNDAARQEILREIKDLRDKLERSTGKGFHYDKHRVAFGSATIYQFELPYGGNIHIIEYGQGNAKRYVMCDTGCGIYYQDVLKMFQKEGIDPRRIEKILVSHYDVDHAGSAAFFARDFGIQICAHKNCRDVIDDRVPGKPLSKPYTDLVKSLMVMAEPAENEIVYFGEPKSKTTIGGTEFNVLDTIQIDGLNFMVLENINLPVGSHTADTVYYYDQNNRILFSGDSLSHLVAEGITTERANFLKHMRYLLNFSTSADKDAMRREMDAFRTIPDLHIFSGHGVIYVNNKSDKDSGSYREVPLTPATQPDEDTSAPVGMSYEDSKDGMVTSEPLPAKALPDDPAPNTTEARASAVKLGEDNRIPDGPPQTEATSTKAVLPQQPGLALDIKNALIARDTILPEQEKEDQGRYYTVRYNEMKMPRGSLAETLLRVYIEQFLPIGMPGKDRFALKGSDKQDQGLIWAECYTDRERNHKIGEGHVDINEDINGKILRIPGIMNMAIAASHIPLGISADDVMSKYDRILSFIKVQYRDITGEILPDKKMREEVLKDPSKGLRITLPHAEKIPPEKIQKYYELVTVQLQQAA